MIFFEELISKLSSYIITYPKITMVISYTISSQVPRRRKEWAGETVEDPSSDEERATSDGDTDVEELLEDADLPPEKPWCPPIPDAPDDPTEMEIAGAADKLETMMRLSTSGQYFLPAE